ncbi:MAG: nucleotidyltransferase family protein [Phycisphaerales bacterium]
MLGDRIEPLIRGAMPDLQRDFGVSAVYVFGSVARGDDRPESDVDVLVEFAADARPTLLTLAGLHGRLTDLLGCPVDLGTVDSLRPGLRDSVRAEMRRVA